MKKPKGWAVTGIIFIVFFGTLLHFLYEWTGSNQIVGVFAPVNESVWEHLKLLFWPAVLFYIVEWIFSAKMNFLPAKAVGLVAGMLIIVAGYYTYTGIAGCHALWADILLFVAAVVCMQYKSFKIQSLNRDILIGYSTIAALIILAFAAAFVVFTFYPPDIPLFIPGN